MCVCIKVHRYKVDAVTLRNGTHAYHVSRTSSLLFLPFFLFDSFFFNYYFGKIFLLLVPHVCARFSFRFLPEKFLTRRVCERLYVKQQFLWIRNTEKNNNNNRPVHTHTYRHTQTHTWPLFLFPSVFRFTSFCFSLSIDRHHIWSLDGASYYFHVGSFVIVFRLEAGHDAVPNKLPRPI